MTRNIALIAGGLLSAAASLLHVACIFGGPAWYRFFGAGEGVAQGSGGDPPLPVLEDVVVVPATALLPARLSGMI